MKIKDIGNFFAALMMSVSVSNADTLSLNSGWNLIGTDSNMSLSDIKSELGRNNVLVIQGPSKTYQKAYVDAGMSSLNDFTNFEKGKGYWIKLSNAATLSFTKMSFSTSEVLSLKSGWNLIDPLSDLNLNTIKNQLGSDNVLVIQGPSKTYQKAYVDAGMSSLNDFTNFENGKGYWIKLKNDANLTFTFNTPLTYIAVDNNDNNISDINFSAGADSFKLGVYTNDNSVSTVSNSTVAIYGNINGTPTNAKLKLNSHYKSGDKFQVKVFDVNGALLGSSSVKIYDGINSIDFGDITISTSGASSSGTSSETSNGSNSEASNSSTGLEMPPSVPDINSSEDSNGSSNTLLTPPSVPDL